MEQLWKQVEPLVRTCGQMLLGRISGEEQVHQKGAADFVTDTDLAVSRALSEGLLAALPGSGIITEEQPEHTFDYSRDTWVIDPLDGTSNYIFNLRISAVSVALFREGKPVLGIIYDPYADEMFHAVRGKGAFLNGSPIHASAKTRLSEGLVAFGTSPYYRELSGVTFQKLQRVFARCIDVRRCGSAALDLAAVACGRTAGFFEQILSTWDYAAGALLIAEAGGRVSRLDGSALRFDGKEPLVAAGPSVYEELLELVAD
ncbi:MAG: inositol monophosphatase [Provencibacterium sp.]|nr:inositol monophosphatase [Provencibacterium sp.]